MYTIYYIYYMYYYILYTHIVEYTYIYTTREATDWRRAGKKKDTVNVAHVINFDFPLNPVDYIHRIGRTGRGGGTGRVTNLVTKVCGHI